jgi:hypothetical protein
VSALGREPRTPRLKGKSVNSESPILWGHQTPGFGPSQENAAGSVRGRPITRKGRLERV